MSPAVVSLVVLVCSVALFVWNRLPVGVVAILTALALVATRVIDVPTALAGFGDPVVIFIATLFVVSEGLEVSGLTAWAGRELTRRAGTGRPRLLAAIMALSGVLSALITPNGAAAALLPVTMTAARRSGLAASRLLAPMAFAASAGALLTLSGSPVNVVANELSVQHGGGGFGFFEYALVGLPLLVATTAVALLGAGLLPDRGKGAVVGDLGAHLSTLIDHYRLDRGFFRLRVTAATAPLPQAALAERDGMLVVGVQDDTGRPAGPSHACRPGDVLVVTGDAGPVQAAADELGLQVDATPLTRATRAALLNQEVGVAEVVIPPRSAAVGRVFFPGMVRGDVTVLGVSRLGRDRGARPTELAEGDALLLHGTWPAVEALARDDEVLLVDSPELLRRQAAPLGRPAWVALAVLVGMVALLATGATPPAVAGLLAATAMVALRVVTPTRAYRAVSWQTVVLIGALIPLSVAIRESGAADLVAHALIRAVGDGHPVLLLLAVFALAAALGQVISNTATALVVFPIALAVGTDAGIGVPTMLMTVVVACGASLLTPIATPANMIVMGPGGYRFGDYWRLGGVTMAVWLAVGVLLVPAIWGLTG